MQSKKRKNTDIKKDILAALEGTFPDNIVELLISFDESYLQDIYPSLKMKLSRLKGSELSYERDAEGRPRWEAYSDPEEDPPDWSEQASSYHLFFVSLTEEKFQYIIESEEPDQYDKLQKIEGIGFIGCLVAVSLIAPYALIKLRSYDRYDNGSETCPDIEHAVFTLEGEPIEMEAHFSETMGEEAAQFLLALRADITTIVESSGITPLSKEDEDKPVPDLKAGEEVSVGKELTGKDITVGDALFFRSGS